MEHVDALPVGEPPREPGKIVKATVSKAADEESRARSPAPRPGSASSSRGSCRSAATAWCLPLGARTGSRSWRRSSAMPARSRSTCRRRMRRRSCWPTSRRTARQVDILVNNAGFGLIGRFAELDAKRERQMIDLNVGTLTDLCRAVAPADDRAQVGRRSSTSPRPRPSSPGPKMAVYFATKAFVLSLSEALHEELKPHGIKVSCLCPGPTRTEFGEVAGFGGNGLFDRVAMESPRSRRGRPRGPRQEQGGGRSRPGQQDRRRAAPLRAALGRSQDRRGDQILISKLKPRCCAAVT